MFLILVLIFSILFIVFLCRQWKYYILSWKLPGPLGLPFIGIAWDTLSPQKLFKTLCELKLKYKSPLTFWMGTQCYLYIDDPQSLQDILLADNCSDKGPMWNTVARAVGDNILTAKYHKWKRLRRLISPWFSPESLLPCFKLFNNNVDNLLKLIDKKVGQGHFDIRDLIKETSFNIVFETMGGKNLFCNDENHNIELTATTNGIELCKKPWHTPWLLTDWVTNDINVQSQCVDMFRDAFYMSLSKNTKLEKGKDYIFQDNDSKDFFYKGLASEKNGDITREELERNCYIFISTAFETMSAHLFLTILCLAMNPEYQEKLAEELVSKLPEDPEFPVTMDNLEDLKYLDMVFNESLRLMPTVPITIRNVSSDITLRSGVTIPQGTKILINIFNTHRNEEFWGKDAHQFNPDHFLPENVAKLHPFAFIPFLKGLRTCIGSKYAAFMSKVFLCKIFRKYRFKTKAKLEDLQFVEEISFAAKNSALIEVIRCKL